MTNYNGLNELVNPYVVKPDLFENLMKTCVDFCVKNMFFGIFKKERKKPFLTLKRSYYDFS